MTMFDRLRTIPVPLQLAAANIGLGAVTFLTGVMLARALGPDGRGVYGALFLWALTAANIFAWGAQITLARQVAQAPERAAAIYRSAYRMSLVGGLLGALAYLAAVISATLGRPEFPVWLVLVASLIIPFSIPNAFQIQIELGRGRYSSFNLVRTLFALLNFLTIAGLWIIGVRSVGVFVATLAGVALVSTVAAMLSIRLSLRGLVSEPRPKLGEIIRGSTPIAMTMLVAGVAQQSDKLLASALFPAGLLGTYLVAGSLAQIQGAVGEALSQMFFARGAAITDLDHIDRVWLGLRLRQTILVYAAICAGALAIVPVLVPYIYGVGFTGAIPLLYLLLPAMALQGMVRPFEEYLRGLHMPVILATISLVVIAFVGAGGIAAHFLGEPLLLAGGAIAGFAAALVTAAVSLGRRLAVSPWGLMVPRPSDAAALIRTLAQRLGWSGPKVGGD